MYGALTGSNSDRYLFGHRYMGPILAECCFLLHRHLESSAVDETHVVLFCSRGGLLIRRALELFTERIGEPMRYAKADFMVSRLTAARLALDSSEPSIQAVLAIEFEGRTCSDVAKALCGVHAPVSGDWGAPYEFTRFAKLLAESVQGKQLRAALSEQVSLLKAHFRAVTRGVPNVHLVDTGVFGSIAQYLRLGMPAVSIECLMLFRAHYKRSAFAFDQPDGIGLVSDCDDYRPWDSRSVSRLYWPFFEAFFEPPLPSVRRYRIDAEGGIVSNLEIPGWRELTQPKANSIGHGAFDYVADLTVAGLSTIRKDATRAWRSIRRRIVYPSAADIDLMGVRDRGLDFGFDDMVHFGDSLTWEGWHATAASVRASVWPEGEIRRLCPRTAPILHNLLELGRLAGAIARLTARH